MTVVKSKACQKRKHNLITVTLRFVQTLITECGLEIHNWLKAYLDKVLTHGGKLHVERA